MRNPLIVIVACVLVLAGAWFTSQMLVSDVPAPAVTTPSTPTTLVPASPEPSPSPPPPVPEAAMAAKLGPRQGPLQPVDPVPSAPPHAVEAAPAPAELAPSPFQGDSKELDYAEALLAEPNPGLERLQSAHQVLSRCVQQEPTNQRCLDALARAQSRLGAKAAMKRQPELLRIDPPQRMRPAAQLK